MVAASYVGLDTRATVDIDITVHSLPLTINSATCRKKHSNGIISEADQFFASVEYSEIFMKQWDNYRKNSYYVGSLEWQEAIAGTLELFILGIVYDMGYEFSEEQKEYVNKGDMALKAQNYKYWQEVFYHGIPQEEYDSPMLQLLNYVDVITGPTGENVTIQDRIDDIAEQYGKESQQEREVIKLSMEMH